jgi:hypothetical protein
MRASTQGWQAVLQGAWARCADAGASSRCARRTPPSQWVPSSCCAATSLSGGGVPGLVGSRTHTDSELRLGCVGAAVELVVGVPGAHTSLT